MVEFVFLPAALHSISATCSVQTPVLTNCGRINPVFAT